MWVEERDLLHVLFNRKQILKERSVQDIYTERPWEGERSNSDKEVESDSGLMTTACEGVWSWNGISPWFSFSYTSHSHLDQSLDVAST